MSQSNRRLAAIMFTDMVGYTALGQKNESLSIALVEDQRKLIRPILERHGGKEIKTIGDAFLVQFPNALDAVRCAYDIQRGAREYNFSLPADRRVHIRIGVHLGDVEESSGDILGDAVNVASRVEPLAEDGGVCLTRQVYDHIQNKFELTVSSLGPKFLKNVSTPVEIFKIQMPWDSVPTEGLDKKRVAILPFVSMSPDPNDGYFADGVTEEIISVVSGIGGISVISRTSVMGYKGTTKKVREIGRELEAGSILEGSLRKAGNMIRITAQLIDVNSDRHLWARNYDRELKDVFAIQGDIAKNVADALQASFSTEARPTTELTGDLEAYTLYLKAMQLYHEGTVLGSMAAIPMFERAIERDSHFAAAYAGLAHSWAELRFRKDYASVMENALAAALKAAELSPNLAEARFALAKVLAHLDREKEAIAEAELAIGINPNLSEGNVVLGWLYLSQGKLEKSLAHLKKAQELDPLSPGPGTWLATVLYIAGRFDESVAVLEKLREFNPSSPEIYRVLGECHMLRSGFDEAQRMFDISTRINPEFDVRNSANQGVLYALTGRHDEALAKQEEIYSKAGETMGQYGQVFIQAALGDVNQVFGALDKLAASHAWPIQLSTHPAFREVRRDPRYSEFCARVGIEPPK
jgi:adenylate cyclase